MQCQAFATTCTSLVFCVCDGLRQRAYTRENTVEVAKAMASAYTTFQSHTTSSSFNTMTAKRDALAGSRVMHATAVTMQHITTACGGAQLLTIAADMDAPIVIAIMDATALRCADAMPIENKAIETGNKAASAAIASAAAMQLAADIAMSCPASMNGFWLLSFLSFLTFWLLSSSSLPL